MSRSLLFPVSPKKSDLLFFERFLLEQGVKVVAGVDEAGRGCLAGPVFAAAVILPAGLSIAGVNDSKLLSANSRESLYDVICRKAVAWAVGSVSHEEIDEINIHRASLKAMQQAVGQLDPIPEFVLVDGRFPLPNRLPQKAIVKGDRRSQSVAAASILAKVSRDRWMRSVAGQFPKFSFEEHKGYGTPDHLREIERFGLTSLHRKSFCLKSLVP